MGIKKYGLYDEQIIVDEYIQGAPVNVLILKYGFKTKKSITDKVKKLYPNSYTDIIKTAKNNRKDYKIDLSVIDNEFNAYFIGLMLTDGYIQDNNKFGIQLVDKDCIEFLSKVTNKQYKKYPPKSHSSLPQYRIIFSSSEQVNKLKRFGIVPNKSHTVQPPQLSHEEERYLPYIIRGIIDGDGCIHATVKGSASFFIATMSKEFAFWIKSILEDKMFMKDISVLQQTEGIWHIGTSLQNNIYKLIALVYDKPYGMMRKYNKLRETFRDYNSGNQQYMLG